MLLELGLTININIILSRQGTEIFADHANRNLIMSIY
jgi:hypothetical protein